MAYLSEIMDRKVTDLDGLYIGKLEDVIAHETPAYPSRSSDGAGGDPARRAPHPALFSRHVAAGADHPAQIPRK